MTRKYGNTQIEINGRTYISAEKLAERSGYALLTIRHYARQGKIPSHKVGHRWMFNLEEVMNVKAPEVMADASTETSAKRNRLLDRI